MKLRSIKKGNSSIHKGHLYLIYIHKKTLKYGKKSKLIKSQLGLKNIEFHSNTPKDTYVMQGFVEVEISVAPYWTQFLANITQDKRRQYGMKQHSTSAIPADMGDTLQNMATEISRNNGDLKMWDKGKMIVILSWTKLAKNIIFVEEINDTISEMKI